MRPRVGLGAATAALVLALLAPDVRPQPEARPISPFEMQPSRRGGKFKVEGPFSIGDPVHETITVEALRGEGFLAPGEKSDARAAVDFIRGVFWNDDPNADLFFGENGLRPSLGVRWYLDFSDAKKGDPAALKTLLGRSHFGDLQFLHGMASREGERPTTTRDNALAWAELAYRLAIGELPVNSGLAALGLPVGKAVASAGGSPSALALFRAQRPDAARKRALGSLLHLLQDSYASGHVARERTPDGERGAILEFHVYTGQDQDKHGHDDGWRGGETTAEKIRALPGGPEALRETRRVLAFYRRNAPWAEVAAHLSQGPLKLAKNARQASAGDAYRKLPR
ncbi:MAG TPA: hypothetical protein VIM73_21205 [Polyangiaceae bacterium]